MKLAEKLLNLFEKEISTVRYIDVSQSLYALSKIVKAIGDDKFANELENKSDYLYDVAQTIKLPKDRFDKEMSKVDLQGTFKKLQKTLGDYEKEGKGLKLGRKELDLRAALTKFVNVSQKAKKEENINESTDAQIAQLIKRTISEIKPDKESLRLLKKMADGNEPLSSAETKKAMALMNKIRHEVKSYTPAFGLKHIKAALWN